MRAVCVYAAAAGLSRGMVFGNKNEPVDAAERGRKK